MINAAAPETQYEFSKKKKKKTHRLIFFTLYCKNSTFNPSSYIGPVMSLSPLAPTVVKPLPWDNGMHHALQVDN